MLSDQIEQLILQLMDKQNDGPVTLSRNELADYLGCAPSQVTYVINTRFTPNCGIQEREWRLYPYFPVS